MTAILTGSDLVTDLYDRGMPVKAVAQVARVSRWQVYRYLAGREPAPVATERLQLLHSMVEGAPDGTLAEMVRIWHSDPRGVPLHAILTSESINAESLRAVLVQLKPLMARMVERRRQGDELVRKYVADRPPWAG